MVTLELTHILPKGLEKAFDTMDHAILLRELKLYGNTS